MSPTIKKAAYSLLVLALPVVPVAGQDERREAVVSREEISQLVKNLESSSFSVRNRATTKLMTAGRHAVTPVLKAAQMGSLEAATRCLRVLGAMLEDEDSVTRKSSGAALQTLAKSESASIAGRAKTFLRRRFQTAIDQIKTHGGKIEEFDDGRFSVEIGRDWKGSSEDLSQITRLSPVVRVSLKGFRAKDTAISRLHPLPSLVALDLSGTDVTGVGLGTLSGFPRLRELTLTQTMISDQSLGPLIQLKTLRKLVLRDTLVTDAAMDSLVKMSQLEHLSLTETRVTSKGFQRLVDLKQLKSLEVMNCRFNSSSLMALQSLKQLQRIDARGSYISQFDHEDFLKIRHDVKIRFGR